MHVDLVGPLPTYRDGHVYLLMAIDRTTRWPEVFTLQGITARECADAFSAGWMACFDVQHTVPTDRGMHFTGGVCRSMCKTLGIEYLTTTAFHPKSNGMVERLHRQLKESLLFPRLRQFLAAHW